MQTWTVRAAKMAQGDWAVFVNEELVERGLSERQASDGVRRWQPREEHTPRCEAGEEKCH